MSETTKKTTPAKKAGVLYSHDSSGGIFRQESPNAPVQVIAHIADGVVTFPGPAEQQKAPAVLRYLKTVGLEVKQVVTAAGGANEAASAVVAETPEPKTGGKVGGKPLGTWEAGPGMPAVPPMDKMAGDKTPERVEWLKRYKPEKFEEVYGVQGEGTVPSRRVVLNKGKREVEIIHKPGLIAARKTHLTIKPQA